jgi:hypothetical protein
MQRQLIQTAALVVLLTGCDLVGPSGTEYEGTYSGEMPVAFSGCSPSIFALSGRVRAEIETERWHSERNPGRRRHAQQEIGA